uniref:Cyclin C n=1 Tax=Oncorhynchus kisutch TaxID=8019 RepID=A0A8C7IKR0_ONCKI
MLSPLLQRKRLVTSSIFNCAPTFFNLGAYIYFYFLNSLWRPELWASSKSLSISPPLSLSLSYFFLCRYSLKSIDPVLMAPTCVFLASKVEEFGVVSNTRLISAATSVLKTRFSYAFPKEFPYRMNHVLECEFYLLELMDCCLIVYHPYRPLLQYVQDMGQEDMLLPLAWRVVNDTYRTDLCLLYPPFMIALACLHVACVVQQKDARQWFAELSVDMEKILEIIRVILKLYDQWKNFDDRKEMAAVLNKMPKPKPPPNSENDQSSSGNQNNSYIQS